MVLFADSEGPDQNARIEGPDQNARMRRLADLGLRCPHMPEDTISHGAAHLDTLMFQNRP